MTKNALKSKKWRVKMILAGKCTRCAEPSVNFTRCASCRSLMNDDARKRYAKRRENNQDFPCNHRVIG